MREGKIEISVVIPVYNSDNSLPELVWRLETTFSKLSISSFEIILIDDGSSNPRTWETLTSLASRHSSVRCMQLMRNFGKAGAVLCGFYQARGSHVITMDDDLQHLPEDIPILLTKKDHDVVLGCFKKRNHGPMARLGSRIKGRFDRIILGSPKDIRMSPYKLFKRKVVKEMLKIQTAHPFIPALMFYVTKDVVAVEINHSSRKYGRPGFTLKKRLIQFLRLLINNSSLLLQAVAAIGFGISFLSACYALYLVARRLMLDVTVSGWTSLMVTTLITSGLILFSLGVVGEYLIRIIDGLESKPAYIVRQSSGQGESTNG